MIDAHSSVLMLAGLLLAAPVCSAQESKNLRGTAFIAGKTAVDPPANEPRNTHAYLQLSGPVALQMYRNMRAREEPNACEGGKMKRAGSLTCSLGADGRTPACDFSIDLQRGTLESGQAC